MDTHNRNYKLAILLSNAGDNLLINAKEVAALTGLSHRTIQQRRLPYFPAPHPHLRHLRWRLGDVRKWIHRNAAPDSETCIFVDPGKLTHPTHRLCAEDGLEAAKPTERRGWGR